MKIYEIPSRLFFEISNSGNLSLLDPKEKDLTKLDDLWLDLLEEDTRLSGGNSSNIFDISINLEKIRVRQAKISAYVDMVKEFEDKEFLELLEKEGFKITSDIDYSLSRIRSYCKNLEIDISKYENLLPKKSESKNELNFDDVIVGWCAFLGISVPDVNTMSQALFRGLENNVKIKFKALESNGK